MRKQLFTLVHLVFLEVSDSSNNLVRFVITQLSDDASDLEKELNEDCLEGTINANGDCVLQSISNKNVKLTYNWLVMTLKKIIIHGMMEL